jgi:thiamine-phosphate pyrophosphorylase
VVTDDAVLDRDHFLPAARSVLEAGGAHVALHVRGPRTGGRALFAVTETLRSDAERTGGRLVVNDRIDVAMALGLDAVHLGARSLGPTEARRLLGSEAVVGVSCHDPSEVDDAVDCGADYVFVGTVFETASHPGRAPLGADGVSAIARAHPTASVMASGGIDPARARALSRAGVGGLGVLRGVWDAAHPGDAVMGYLDAFTGAQEAMRSQFGG